MNTMTNWLKAIGLGLFLLSKPDLEASNGLTCGTRVPEPVSTDLLVTTSVDPGNDSSLAVLSGFFLSAQAEPHCLTILGIEHHPRNQLIVFDATGREVWSCENYHNQWCGPARPGMYYYVLILSDGSTLCGTLKISG